MQTTHQETMHRGNVFPNYIPQEYQCHRKSDQIQNRGRGSFQWLSKFKKHCIFCPSLQTYNVYYKLRILRCFVMKNLLCYI